MNFKATLARTFFFGLPQIFRLLSFDQGRQTTDPAQAIPTKQVQKYEKINIGEENHRFVSVVWCCHHLGADSMTFFAQQRLNQHIAARRN
jgi:hypothetical protein